MAKTAAERAKAYRNRQSRLNDHLLSEAQRKRDGVHGDGCAIEQENRQRDYGNLTGATPPIDSACSDVEAMRCSSSQVVSSRHCKVG